MALGQPRISVADEVAQELRSRILAGRYQPGMRLRQEELAADMDVSRTPIREAMRTLEREGLVVSERHGGVSVTPRSPGTLASAYELREVVDGLAARLAAGAVDDALRRRLGDELARQRRILDRTWSPDDWTAANTSFHGAIMAAGNNPYVGTLVPFVAMTSQVFRPMSVLGRDRAEQAYAEHSAIADAVLGGDAPRAERLARRHIRGTRRALKVDDGTTANATSTASPADAGSNAGRAGTAAPGGAPAAPTGRGRTSVGSRRATPRLNAQEAVRTTRTARSTRSTQGGTR